MRRVVALLSTVALLASACGGASDESAAGQEGPHPNRGPGEGLVVVTSVFPNAWMAEQIAPGAEFVHLASGEHGAHSLTLSPGDRASVASADVVLSVGQVGFQPQIEAAIAAAEGEVVSLASVAGDRLLAFPGRDRAVGGHEHEGDAGAPRVDPHVWFDPAIMRDAAEAVAEAFAAVDPAAADAYRSNAEAVSAELAEVGAHADERLKGDCEHGTAIVSHEAYQYLLEPYGHEQVGISGAGGHTGATPRRIAELTRRIEEEAIPAVLAEPLEGRRDAEALAREAGVELISIHPLGAVSDEESERGYPAMLREQIDAFAEALGCA